MSARLSGFCNRNNPRDSHERCPGDGCVCACHWPTLAAGDPVAGVAQAVEALQEALPALLEACTDPEATDMAELFADLLDARKALQAAEREVEVATAKAMLSDQALTPTLRAERRRATDRKSWDHDDWKRDVRNKVVRATGLAGAQGVLSADGEVLPPDTLWDALTRLQEAHGAAAPKTGALRALGLDARDYCESKPGAWHVTVQRLTDETTNDQEVA